MSMKLVIAIVQNEDNQKLNNALVKEGFRSTRLATSGGFLRTGNTTVMIGVEESKLEEVLGIIESVCKARKQTVSAVAPSVDTTGFYIPYPVEVSVGGATVFIPVSYTHLGPWAVKMGCSAEKTNHPPGATMAYTRRATASKSAT